MTQPGRLEWANAFVRQSRLDFDLASGLYKLVGSKNPPSELGQRPELYCPAIYAYCQQAVEKALKAWLWYEDGSIRLEHNPLDRVFAPRRAARASRPPHMAIVDRNRNGLKRLLDMAPRASEKGSGPQMRLNLPNTEYPFVSGRRVKCPHEVIGLPDVGAALKLAERLVPEIEKYFAAQGFAPG